MIIENPTRESGSPESCFCAIRKRNPDGTPAKGKGWLEPMGSIWPFIDDQKTWEVVMYGRGDAGKLPE